MLYIEGKCSRDADGRTTKGECNLDVEVSIEIGSTSTGAICKRSRAVQLKTGFVTRQPLNMRRNAENGLFVLVVLLLGFSHVILLCHYNDNLLIKAQLFRRNI